MPENNPSRHHAPKLTVDVIVEINDKIVIIKRKNQPRGYALPGGFVEYGETLEQAAVRESKEEININITDLKQFKAYSDPKRDPRWHAVTMVFIAKGAGVPEAGSDAKEAMLYDPMKEKKDFVFDHNEIINDYVKYKLNT